MPEQDAVLAITAESDDLQGILNVIWEILLTAMKEGSLPPDEAGVKLLKQKLQRLALSTVSGDPGSPVASEISGRTFTLDPNYLLANHLWHNDLPGFYPDLTGIEIQDEFFEIVYLSFTQRTECPR